MATTPTLTQAIEQAVQSEKLPQDLSERPGLEDSQEAPEKEATKPEHEPEPEIDEETIQGRRLVQALKNPAEAAVVIDMLARQAGYSKIETKADVKSAADEITDIFKVNLGDEFSFLAPKIAKGVKEALEVMRKENTADPNADLRARIEAQELKDIKKETAETHVALSQEFFGADEMPDDVLKAMSAAMDEFPPTNSNMAPSTYYRKIFSLVAGEKGLTKRTSSQRERVASNRNDASARLRAESRGVLPGELKGNTRPMKLEDAVKLAMEQVNVASSKH